MHQKLIVNKACNAAVLAHIDRWKGCTLCPLHVGSKQKVFFRGYIPCDVLIIGVGPLPNDEDVGKAMMGDNGAIIDEIIEGTMEKFKLHNKLSKMDRPLKTCITNSVLCRNNSPPDKDNIRACSKRLAEFVNISKPKLLIAAGKEAGSAIISLLAHLPEYPRSIEIRGPGYVARLSGDDRSVEMERIKLSVTKALNNVFGQKAVPLTENDEE